MKKILISVFILVTLTACRTSPYTADGSVSLPDPALSLDHSHAVFEGNNVTEHDAVGYCGNTVTTVRCVKGGKQEESWEYSFWGSTSVELTDLLRWLDYEEDICRCLPEYYVKTEFSNSEYGINLSEGYVRFDGKQIQLTEEQVQYLRQMMSDIAADKEDGFLCGYPLSE